MDTLLDTLPFEAEDDYAWLMSPSRDEVGATATVDNPDKNATATVDNPDKNANAADDNPDKNANAAVDNPDTKTKIPKRTVLNIDDVDPKLVVAKPGKRKRLKVTDSDFVVVRHRTGHMGRAWRWIDDPPSDLDSDELECFIE